MPVRGIFETFPLAGDLLDGRTFWATVVVPESEVTGFLILVWERKGGGWREVARHELGYHLPGPVTPVRIEPAHAWIVANGASGARSLPEWEVLRFDGESLNLEVVDGWSDIMLADVDGDGTLDVLGEHVSHVSAQADLPHADAMRRAFLLFDAGAGSCAGVDCAERPQRLADAPPDTGVTPWRPWRAPAGDTGRPLTEAPDGADLNRRFAAVYRGDGGSLDDLRAFPLAGSQLQGREFWVVFDPSADTCRTHRLGVSIRFDEGWRAVTQRTVPIDVISTVAPVDIESSQAWLVVAGVENYHVDANEPLWEVLRFDGESLHVDVFENWLDAMIVDVDGDGAREVLGSRARPLCDECFVTRRAVRLFRWDGARLRAAPLEFLSAGSTSDAAVTANNRTVALARARRWMEAVAVLDAARPLVAESVVFRRNASLIDLNAGASGTSRPSGDDLLHHVFAGSWADAVDLFRGAPAGPDLFAEPLPYIGEAARSESRYGATPFLRAVFDATAAARAVAPARAEIEFLHAWSALHLDPDTTVAPLTWRDARYRVDVEEAAVLETLERAAALAPGDLFFAEAWRVAVDKWTR